MLEGVMLLWWILTIPSFLFVVIDIWRTTPESVVLKWAFVILTAFTGPLGAFFYVLGCREPLRGNHEQYVAARWRQVLGSTMHCVAGDGIGIVVGAAIGGVLAMSFGRTLCSSTFWVSGSDGPSSRPSRCATQQADRMRSL
jgi:hypothetical protein